MQNTFIINTLACWLIFFSLAGGCSRSQPQNNHISQKERIIRTLKRVPTVKSISDWTLPEMIKDRSGCQLQITTKHYLIYTNLTDPLIIRQLPVLLESAFGAYVDVLGQGVDLEKKLIVYFFDKRGQWEDFTRHWTGPQAENYLKIQAGAYYFKGASVAYRLTRRANFSVLAHEGWHQFSDEVFKFHLPAWLDEGLATNFEAYQWDKGKVAFEPRHNGSRLWALKETMRQEKMFDIAELLVLDAGRVLSHSTYVPEEGKSDPQVAAYYAQLYALVRFLREYNYSLYLLDFQDMLSDGYQGRWPLSDSDRLEAARHSQNPTRRWNAAVGPLIFRRYIAHSPEEIRDQYRIFCLRIITDMRFKK